MTTRDRICIVPEQRRPHQDVDLVGRPGCLDWIDPGGERGTASAWDHGPRAFACRLRRLGCRGRWLVGRVRAAGRRRVDRRHPPRARARRQLDRHRADLRRRALGGRRRSRDRRPRGAAARVHEVLAAPRRGGRGGDRPAGRLHPRRVRGVPAPAGRGAHRPVPGALARAGRRRLARGGLVDAGGPAARGQDPPPRRLQLRGLARSSARRPSLRWPRCSRSTRCWRRRPSASCCPRRRPGASA